MIALLLFVSALRIGPHAALGGLRDLGGSLRLVLLYQLALPLCALGLVVAFGVASAPAALALVFVLAAPSVTGNPNFAIMMGEAPEAAMRLLMVGTLIFPLTALPILWLSPALADFTAVLTSAARLIAVIVGAVGVAFALRWRGPRTLGDDARQALDGTAAILLAVVVIGLMSAVGPALLATPGLFAIWLLFACGLNFAAQALAIWGLGPRLPPEDRVAVAVVAGNRNVALYLVALPVEVAEQLLLFIGCYQVPMYLTPLVMRPFLSRRARKP